MRTRVIGILGGMGPEATADLFRKIIRATPATRDQDHLRVIIDSNPRIPDRTAAVLGSGQDPVPALRETARNLERAGADFIIMPCNTAHYFYPAIQASVGIPVLHMVKETVQAALARVPGLRRVGLLATSGTLAAGLYHGEFAAVGVEVVVPGEEAQARLMAAIYGPGGIKAGQAERVGPVVREIALGLVEEEVQAVIAGCTELPLVLADGDLPVPVIDSTEVLAKAAVRTAMT